MEIVLNIQYLAIKEKSPLFHVTVTPQQMMNYPPGGPHPWVLRQEGMLHKGQMAKKHSYRPALNDVVSGTSCWARQQADKRQN